MKSLVALIVAALIAGCANYETMTTEEFSNRQVVEDSEFERHLKLDGGRIVADLPGGLLDTGSVYLRFRGWIDKNSPSIQSHQLYMHITYSTPNSWRFYKRATFLGGAIADLKEISREVNFCMTTRCDYTEVVGVDIPVDMLLLGEEIRLQVSAKSGHKAVVSVPQNYVIAYFDLIRENANLLASTE